MIGQSEHEALTAGHITGPSEQMVAQFAAEPGYWSAFVDISERVEGLPEALDDDARSSTPESSSDEEGVGPSRRAVAAPMDPEFLKTMTISNEFRSVPGLGEASLQVGQTFPDKDSLTKQSRGKYKGTLLVAIAADANNQLLPIAYALVESENKDSWLWFLSCLKMGVVIDRPDVSIISDRNTGLLSALEIIKNSSDPLWGWPDLETRWCMRHLAANFYSKFKNKDWFKLFKRMCVQNTEAKMNAIWAGINKEIEKAALPPREYRRGRRTEINLSTWINQNCPDLSKWAQAHDSGARYGIMTSNMSEVHNGVLKGRLTEKGKLGRPSLLPIGRRAWRVVTPPYGVGPSGLFRLRLFAYLSRRDLKLRYHLTKLQKQGAATSRNSTRDEVCSGTRRGNCPGVISTAVSTAIFTAIVSP
ncbi:hypothetical protein QYE76_064564 [Lolium multiflorum]|uniref:MULE transposase domain-containing protein n=1 Tax=Lolium multiflorum TaxID=4521 RepID=A0AAD8WA38_LOLMU|nr:hypothetical protein QYE76_064564 [Lolium multiflorum]